MKKFLLSLLSIAVLGLGICRAQNKPNILLIVSDDHGLDALGCYGNNVIETPSLDELAKDGMRFTNAFCTSASCSASRSVLLTGKFNHATAHYGHEHSYHHFSTFADEISLPVYLEEGGYRTARVGKYHLAPESVYHFQQVFDANSRNPVEMAKVSEDFIRDKSAPFFLYYCTSDPHRAWALEDRPLQPNSFGNREDGHYAGVEEVHYNADEVLVPEFLPDTKECRAELAQYYQSVTRVDQGIGKLVETLKDEGIYDNTIIIYISDNGIAFPGAKTNLYDPGMKLPCIIKLRDQEEASSVNENLISWVDLTPTILDLADIHPEKNTFHGRSFKKILKDPKSEGADEVYASHTFHEVTMYYPMRVVRDKQYKFIYNIAYGLGYPSASDLWESPTWQSVYKNGEDNYFGKRTIHAYLNRPQFELYDIINDPDEVENLAYDNKYESVLKEYITKIQKFQKETGDPWILKWEHE